MDTHGTVMTKNALKLLGLLTQREVKTVDFTPSYIWTGTDRRENFSLPTPLT